jgi:hypothetical protein
METKKKEEEKEQRVLTTLKIGSKTTSNYGKLKSPFTTYVTGVSRSCRRPWTEDRYDYYR